MENLELYEKVRAVPEIARKEIKGGRLKGMTDINPMWRIKTLTEQFGVCGIGWKPEIVRTWLDVGVGSEVVANVEIKLYVKVDGVWSDGIPGVGGSRFVAKETGGLFTDDEAYKKAYTDALSVACKSLGIGADVYWEKDSTKYSPTDDGQAKSEKRSTVSEKRSTENKKSKWVQVNELIKESSITLSDVNDWIVKKFGRKININALDDEKFNALVVTLKKAIAKEMSDE